MKKLNLVRSVLATCLFLLSTYSMAGNSGGGGDASEMRVNEIRIDILKWISNGGPSALDLPRSLNLQTYNIEMNKYLTKHFVVVSFVTMAQERETTDPELKVTVNGQPKTCRSFISTKDNLPHTLCNVERFAAETEAAQYRLIHHEYAVLAGLEENVGAASDYGISNQITDYLDPVPVLRLAVRGKTSSPKDSFKEMKRFCDSIKHPNCMGYMIEALDKQAGPLVLVSRACSPYMGWIETKLTYKTQLFEAVHKEILPYIQCLGAAVSSIPDVKNQIQPLINQCWNLLQEVNNIPGVLGPVPEGLANRINNKCFVHVIPTYYESAHTLELKLDRRY